MPVGAFVPSRIHLDYPEWRAPTGSDSGKVWAWNGSGYAPVSLAFDPVGTAAAAVAAHVVAENPHSQYYLASGVSVYGATLASAVDAAAARTALAHCCEQYFDCLPDNPPPQRKHNLMGFCMVFLSEGCLGEDALGIAPSPRTSPPGATQWLTACSTKRTG